MPPRARMRFRARAISVLIASAVAVPLFAPAANAVATTSRSGSLTGQDTIPAAAASPAPVVAPVATPAPKPAAATAHVTAKKVVKKRIVRHTLAQRAITEARRHYGAPYRWGATGPRSFDCSGFTGYVFRKVGVHLPRTSREQYRAVRHVSRSAKRVGDLIFDYSSSGRIHHVGIYVGHGRMIAATHTGDVVRTQAVRGRYKVGRVR